MPKQKSKKTKLLSLDQATYYTGFAIYVDGELKEYGLLDHSSKEEKKNPEKRTVNMAHDIISKAKNVDKVIFEDVFLKKGNVHTLVMLARLQGMIIQYCIEANLDFEILKASEWRKSLGLKNTQREEAKMNSIEFVKYNYGLDVCEDVADAICIGQGYLNRGEHGNK